MGRSHDCAARRAGLRGAIAAAGEQHSEVDEDGNLYARLWGHLGAAIRIADVTAVLDNSSARAPFRPCASFEYGVLIGSLSWPTWTPYALREAEGSVDHGQRDGG
ncbi:hypothetical protein [Arthrobacter sp. H5]|uniref:hypothetical protein n=1 Tax=Arthrobacter sp. H5 TaxID=1267973 RepID=UPI00047FB011|nr:hypothetical protein [Arthrobacter sp. H5]